MHVAETDCTNHIPADVYNGKAKKLHTAIVNYIYYSTEKA